jgi:hypothetical protein
MTRHHVTSINWTTVKGPQFDRRGEELSATVVYEVAPVVVPKAELPVNRQ